MTPRVSILVTAFREPKTLSVALDALTSQAQDIDAEIIVICPDNATAQTAASYESVTILRDPGLGKPKALNLGLQAARGMIIVMTDGDVSIEPGALSALLAPFSEPRTGAVSSRPVSINSRDTMLGYWSHLLTEAGAHVERLERDRLGEFFICSGYLYAIQSGLITDIPEYALAEDAVISHIIGAQGYQIRYAPDARVLVKYPTTYKDWLKQKVRSAGGYAQPIIANSSLRMRSFWHELLHGTLPALMYPRNFREFIWSLALFGARLHLWLLILWRVKLRRQPLHQLWQRVESTK